MNALEAIQENNRKAFEIWELKALNHGHGCYRVYDETAIPAGSVYCLPCRGFFGPLVKEVASERAL